MEHFDFVIAGAGIVGLTTALTVLRRAPAARLAIIEKEPGPGRHASGRNSGVLHCGLYYGSDTKKAKVCATGGRIMAGFAAEHGIRLNRCGKVLVATDPAQLPAMERLLANARDGGIRATRIDNRTLLALEPAAPPEAVAAIHCPDTAVIDVKGVLAALVARLTEAGARFFFQRRVAGPGPDGAIATTAGPVAAGFLFNCAGAYADVLARAHGFAQNYALVPFKGLYWKLAPASAARIRGNIYPVPDMAMPFLGVHLTRGISGDVYVGPTAIPALGRENYGIFAGAHPKEAAIILTRLARLYLADIDHFRLLAHTELRKYAKSHFYRCARRLMPSLGIDDLVPTTKAGIRPQLVNLAQGRLEMDYILEGNARSLHVLNAISPAFTGSFAFAEMIVAASGAV
ncbi:FAD-dependent oxidoreductase [Desulfovibrio sp. DV]|uniref:L-2-hydroxyglutarate oxidase n=1 Tax=Desulfovibrio sp. DV TaxID=1844708 RepID=UPI00094BA5C8|nr:L-2-hydroxyglutarate oxidase [Desulfovibrio sp. DV]OLN26141.1 FAD-dependent oxidoreductase [Desulfovibrio sp. DV]